MRWHRPKKNSVVETAVERPVVRVPHHCGNSTHPCSRHAESHVLFHHCENYVDTMSIESAPDLHHRHGVKIHSFHDRLERRDCFHALVQHSTWISENDYVVPARLESSCKDLRRLVHAAPF